MKNRILKLCSVMVLLLVTVFTFSACNKDKGDGGPIATFEGFNIESVEILHIEADYYNLEVGVTNTNSEIDDFDFGDIVLRLNGSLITHNADSKLYEPGEYYKWSFSIDEGQGISVGDIIDVYYEGQKLTSVKVTEF